MSRTYSYLIASRRGGEALIIDPVLEKVDRYLQPMRELDVHLVKVVDTHLQAPCVIARTASARACIAHPMLTPSIRNVSHRRCANEARLLLTNAAIEKQTFVHGIANGCRPP